MVKLTGPVFSVGGGVEGLSRLSPTKPPSELSHTREAGRGTHVTLGKPVHMPSLDLEL